MNRRPLGPLVVMIAVISGCASTSATSTSVTTPTAATFTVSSPVVAQGGALPVEFTCEGSSDTPPLRWRGVPAGTVGYAVVMHHVRDDGDTHRYWVLYGLGADVEA